LEINKDFKNYIIYTNIIKSLKDNKYDIFKNNFIDEILKKINDSSYESIINYIENIISIEQNKINSYNIDDHNIKYDEVDIKIIEMKTKIINEYYTLESYLTRIALTIGSKSLNEIETEQIGIRHSPFPFYSSVDIYTFTYSLFYSQIFHSYVKYSIEKKNNNNILKFLNLLFDEFYFNLLLHSYDNLYQKVTSTGNNANKIGDIHEIPKSLNLPQKKDVSGIYKIFNIANRIDENLYNTLNKRQIVDNIYLTKSKKMCITECADFTRNTHKANNFFYSNSKESIDFHGQGTFAPKTLNNICKTNRYSMSVPLSTIYEWDKCYDTNK
jgi:hypothetical protein